MSEIIKFHALDLSGETGLKLYLRKDDGSLLNTGGDDLAEISSSGVFEATLAESRTGLGTLSVRVCDGTETADNLLYDDFLPESSSVIGAKRDAVLDTAVRTAIAAAVDVKLTAEHGAGSWASGGSGGGDNTEVMEAIDSMKSIISEWIALNIPTDVRGFPATIIGGTDIEVSIEVVDSNNDPITEIFGESVETVQWLFGMGTSARRARILGSVEWTSDDLLLISMAKADTLSEDDGPRTWMIGCQLTGGEVKWVKTGVTRLIGRQFAEPTTTTTGA